MATAPTVNQPRKTCGFCKGILKELRYLGCNHPFCTECFIIQTSSADNRCSITCPTCSKVTYLSLGEFQSTLKSYEIAVGLTKLFNPNTLSGMSGEVHFSSRIQRPECDAYLGAANINIQLSTSDSSINKIPQFSDAEDSVEERNNKVRSHQNHASTVISHVQGIDPGAPSKNPNYENNPLIRDPSSTEEQCCCCNYNIVPFNY